MGGQRVEGRQAGRRAPPCRRSCMCLRGSAPMAAPRAGIRHSRLGSSRDVSWTSGVTSSASCHGRRASGGTARSRRRKHHRSRSILHSRSTSGVGDEGGTRPTRCRGTILTETRARHCVRVRCQRPGRRPSSQKRTARRQLRTCSLCCFNRCAGHSLACLSLLDCLPNLVCADPRPERTLLAPSTAPARVPLCSRSCGTIRGIFEHSKGNAAHIGPPQQGSAAQVKNGPIFAAVSGGVSARETIILRSCRFCYGVLWLETLDQNSSAQRQRP